MKKIVINNSETSVVLVGRRINLTPKGTKDDRKTVSAELAEHPEVKHFENLKKISVLSLEEAAVLDKKAAAPKAAVKANRDAPPDIEAKAKAAAKAAAEAKEKEEADAVKAAIEEAEAKEKEEAESEKHAEEDTSSKKKKKKRKN